MKRGSSVLQPPSDAAKRHTHPADAHTHTHTHTHTHAHTKTHTGGVGAAAAANARERTPDTHHNVQGSSPFPAATSLFSPDVSTKMASDLLIRLSEATQKAQVHPGSRVEEELQLQQQPPPPPPPPLSSQRREALLEARGGQQDEPGLALSPDGPGASPEPPSLTHTPDGNATAAAATDTLASDLLRKLAERQEVNCHGVRVKEEEEPMEIDTVASASDLIHDHRPITKELTSPSPSRPHFAIKAEDDDDDQGFSGNNQTVPEQPHPHGAKMAEQCLLGLKIEDAFFTGAGCQSGSKTAGDGVGVSGGNKFEFRFKMEDNGISGAKMADQLLSAGAKMDEQFLFKAKLAERPFSGAKVGRRFLSGVKTEEPFPPAVKLENGLATGDQLFSRAKTEEQLFFGGANMEDQCLRAVLWQDMSVNLASTLLHQLSERVSKSNSQLLERSTPPMRSSPILKVNMDPLRSSPFLSSQETTQETESVLRSDRSAGCSYFYRCHVCGFETDGRRGLFHSHMAEHRQWEHGSFSLHCCVCDHSTNQEAEMRAHAATHIQGDTGVVGGDGRCPVVTAAVAAAASSSSSGSSLVVAMPTQAEEKSAAGAASEHRCRICQRSFPGQQELLVHFQGHRQGNQYRCDRCGHLTRTANKLVEHVRVHTGERPFTCQLCPYSAKRRDSLRLHCKVKHAAAAGSAVATAAAHVVNGNPADGGAAPGDVHTHRSYVHGDNQRSNSNKHVQRLHTPSYTHAAAARCSMPPLHPSLSALSPLLPITTLISLKPRPLPPPPPPSSSPPSSSSSSSPPSSSSSSSKHSFLSYLGLTTPL